MVRTFIRELKNTPLPGSEAHPVRLDHHLQRDVREKDRLHPPPPPRQEPPPPPTPAGGALASLNSVAKIPYRNVCQDGVSNTFSIVPHALGRDQGGAGGQSGGHSGRLLLPGAHHLNVNVMDRATPGGRHGTPGEISQSHHPCLGLRGQLQPPVLRAAGGGSSSEPSTAPL